MCLCVAVCCVREVTFREGWCQRLRCHGTLSSSGQTHTGEGAGMGEKETVYQ